MNWPESTVIAKPTLNECEACVETVVLKRYDKTVDCLNRDCGEATEYQLLATIQPADMMSRNEGDERGVMGSEYMALIVAHYYPMREEHTEQIDNGLYVVTDASKYTINGFSATDLCADRITYQGQEWRAIKTECVSNCCHEQPELDLVCRAYFCLVNCSLPESVITQQIEGLSL